MKVKATEQGKPLPFPKLMISVNGMIVLFTDHGNGTVLVPGPKDQYAIGYTFGAWNAGSFEDYTGVLELSNAG